MVRTLLSLVLGILPQALYFTLFITKVKEIKTKRIKLLIAFFAIIALMVMATRYNIYLYLLIIPLFYFTMKALYQKKTQIIDVFIIALAYGYLNIVSYLCSLIYRNNMNLYWIAYLINNAILFSVLLFSKYLIKAYRLYIKVWNRKPENKVRSISVRNISLILLNVFILILDVIIINNLK